MQLWVSRKGALKMLPRCPETPEGGSDNFVYFTKKVRQDLPGDVPDLEWRSAKSGTGSRFSCGRGTKEKPEIFGNITIVVIMAERIHLFPYRTQKLSSLAPKVLSGRLLGRIGHRHISFNASVFPVRCFYIYAIFMLRVMPIWLFG